MALPNPSQLAGAAWGAALRACRYSTDLAIGTVAVTAGTARAGAQAVWSAAGPLLVDPGANGRLAEAAGAMFEPVGARRTRRVWAAAGRVHVELAAPILHGPPTVRRTLCRRLERLDGVEWVVLVEAVGRVVVGFDERRLTADDVIATVSAVERARGGPQIFPQDDEHPADLEPLLTAAVALLVDLAAVGLAYAGKALPVPALTRHATVVLTMLDTQPPIRRALSARIGPAGTDLVFIAASALLHAATQSPTVPALNAAAAALRIVEVSGRRAAWQRLEPHLCRPEAGDAPAAASLPPEERPVPLADGPIEAYLARLGPTTVGATLGLLALTRRPTRSADLLKGLSPKAALQGRESFAAGLDLAMCRRDVLPVDGSAYRRLDRIDAVVIDGEVLTVAGDLDPMAEPLLAAVRSAGHRLVVSGHAPVAPFAGLIDEIPADGEPLAATVRRLQADGHGVLAVSTIDRAGLAAADIGIAVAGPGRPPVWDADLITGAGLEDVWRLVQATTRARALSETVVAIAGAGNLLGALLAALGRPESGQRKATTPGKSATAFTMALGIWSAIRADAERLPPDRRA